MSSVPAVATGHDCQPECCTAGSFAWLPAAVAVEPPLLQSPCGYVCPSLCDTNSRLTSAVMKSPRKRDALCMSDPRFAIKKSSCKRNECQIHMVRVARQRSTLPTSTCLHMLTVPWPHPHPPALLPLPLPRTQLLFLSLSHAMRSAWCNCGGRAQARQVHMYSVQERVGTQGFLPRPLLPPKHHSRQIRHQIVLPPKHHSRQILCRAWKGAPAGTQRLSTGLHCLASHDRQRNAR